MSAVDARQDDRMNVLKGVDLRAAKRQESPEVPPVEGPGENDEDQSADQPTTQGEASPTTPTKTDSPRSSASRIGTDPTTTGDPSAIEFNLDGPSFTSSRVFDSGLGVLTLEYELAELGNKRVNSLRVSDATLYQVANKDSRITAVGSGQYSTQTQNVHDAWNSETSESRLTIHDDNFQMRMSGDESESGPYYLNVTWNYRNENGSSHSGLFGIETEVFPNEFVDHDLWNPSQSPPSLAKMISEIDNDREDVSTNGPSSSKDVDAIATGQNSDDENAESSGGGGGGLSTAAKAGIGAGAGVVGLAIIGALLWFFLFRRRRNRGGKGLSLAYRPPGAQSSGYTVTKETSAVAESPRSPYSEDGDSLGGRDAHNAHPPLPPHGAHGQQAQAPSSRRPSHEQADRQRQQASNGTHSATPGGGPDGSLSNESHPNVSHLIEDGMTEDEIRRLEEEERALDDAIERAGQRRRGPGRGG